MSNLEVFLKNNKWLETLPDRESNEITGADRKNSDIICDRKNVFGKYDSSGFIQYVKEKSKKG